MLDALKQILNRLKHELEYADKHSKNVIYVSFTRDELRGQLEAVKELLAGPKACLGCGTVQKSVEVCVNCLAAKVAETVKQNL